MTRRLTSAAALALSLAHVGQKDLLADADPPGDGLADLSRPDNDDDFCHSCSFQIWVCGSRSQRRNLVDGTQAVEGAGIADEREKLGQHVDEAASVVADVQVGRDVVPAEGGVPATKAPARGKAFPFTSRLSVSASEADSGVHAGESTPEGGCGVPQHA
jgi:hypothetical protein